MKKDKNILRTSEAENSYFFKNAQPGLDKCGSYKEKCNERASKQKLTWLSAVG